MTTDKEFATSRQVLAAKRKELKEKGKGNRPNASEPLSSNEQTVLRENGVMGTESPEALLNTVWFYNTTLYGIRGGTESRNLRWGDIKLKKTDSGREYIEFNERVTKTRTAETSTEIRAFPPKQFSHVNNPETCPVYAYKKYAMHRPTQMMGTDAPFYLAINHTRRPGSNVWYKNAPMGENTLRGLMKKMAEKGKLQGRKTNHSARKTTCTKLLHSGIAPTTIQQLSGHKNVQSVNNYAKASLEMQEEMSDILSDNPSRQNHHQQHVPTLIPAPRPVSAPTSLPAIVSGIEQSTTQGTLIQNTMMSENMATKFGLGHILNNAKMFQCSITVNNYQHPSTPKRRRIRIIDSDSE